MPTKMDLLKALALMMAAQQNIIELDVVDKAFISGVLGGHALKD